MDSLTETIQRLVREAGGADNCRIIVDTYPDGYQVCRETNIGGLHQYKTVIVKRESGK